MARIVVADDDEDIRDLVVFKLKLMGHEVETYPDGRSALQAVRTSPPDLVVLDGMMPGLSGFDTARAMRELEHLSAVPIMLLTARAQEADIAAGFDAGADDYVTKPFRMNEFGERVNELLAVGVARRQAQDEA